MAEAARYAPPLRLPVKLAYGSGAIAYGVVLQALSTLLLLFYNQVVGLPAAAVGAALMIALIVDALADPLIGVWSDSVRTRWGRRHPFMYAAAVPLAICFSLLWAPPESLSKADTFTYLLVLLIACRLLASAAEIPAAALAPELAPNYDERTNLISYRFFFIVIGAMAMTVVAYMVFLRQDATHPLGLLNRPGYAGYGLTAALVLSGSVVVAALGTHARIPYLQQPPRRRRSFGETAGELIATLRNQSLFSLVLSGLISGIGGGLTTSLLVYVNTYFWELKSSQTGFIVLGGVVSGVVSVILAPLVSRRYGKKWSMIGLFSVSVLTNAAPIWLRLIGLMPPNHSPWLLPILVADQIVTTTLATMGFIIVTSMMADIVEDAAVKTGRRSEGLLFATNNLMQKAISGVGTFLSGLLLMAVNFPAHAVQGQVEPGVLRTLVLIYMPSVAGLSTLSIMALLLYKIDRATHEQNLATIGQAAASLDCLEEPGAAYADPPAASPMGSTTR
jgi:Na+/melibiose symporter-like transporter